MGGVAVLVALIAYAYVSVESVQSSVTARFPTPGGETAPAGKAEPLARGRGSRWRARLTLPQLAALFTSSPIRFSSAGVSFVSAQAVGHIEPSSKFATSLKPKVA